MASTLPIPFLLLLLLLPLLSFLIITSSTPTHHLLLPLIHTLTHSSPAAAAAHNHLKSSSLRSSARFRNKRHRQLSLPLSAGSDYTLSLSLGPSAPSVDLYMDTGSDLVWFPCSPFQCILCEGKQSQSQPPPPNSTLVTCSDPSCSAAHSSTSSSSSLCSIANCPLQDIETSSCSPARHHCPKFYYAYGDGSLIAHLRRGPLSLTSSLSLPNFTFACAHSALAEPVGVAGFGRGILSLPNQLSSIISPSLGGRFSYCLISHSFQQAQLIKPSPLILGRAVSDKEELESVPFIYTPMLHNPKYPYFYSVGLEAVSIGNKRIVAGSALEKADRDGNGGLVVDSGTTFTMLPSALYAELSSVFMKMMSGAGFKRAAEVEAETGLRPCYHYSGGRDSRKVPRMALHFVGNVSVELPRRNYFMGYEREGKKERVGCLMVMDSGGDEAGGPAGTLGNFQQQGFEVVYDLVEGRVGFARRRCEGLWDALSRG